MKGVCMSVGGYSYIEAVLPPGRDPGSERHLSFMNFLLLLLAEFDTENQVGS